MIYHKSKHLGFVNGNHGYIVYNKKLNNAMVIDEKAKEFIESLDEVHIPCNKFREDESEFFSTLCDAGLFLPDGVTEKSLITQKNDDYLERFSTGKPIDSITLQSTTRCNFACPNCIAHKSNENSTNMSFDTAKSILDSFIYFKKAVDDDFDFFNLSYGGKEPLCNFELIEKTEKYLATEYPSIQHVSRLVSNITQADEKVISFLKENKIHIITSLDGNMEANDANRIYMDGRGTYHDIIDKIKLFQQLGYPLDTINMVITETSRLLLRMDFLSSLPDMGIHEVAISFDEVHAGSINAEGKLTLIADAMRYAEKLNLDISGSWGKPRDYLSSKSYMMDDAYAHCNAFSGKGIFVDQNGYIRVCAYAEATDVHISKIEEAILPGGLLYNSIKKELLGNNEMCDGCDFEGSCVGMCPATRENAGAGIVEQCDFIRSINRFLLAEELKNNGL